MKILVTGACGVLGAAVLKEGLRLKHEITIITRSLPSSSYAFKVRDEIKVIFRKDIFDQKTIEVIRAQDIIINLDGSYNDKELTQRNVKQPQELYRLLHPKQYFIHCSTNATLSDGCQNQPVTEENWGNSRKCAYAESKLQFDKWLKKNETVPTMVLHPGYILGKWDAGPSSGAIFLKLAMGQIKSFVNRPKSFITSGQVANFIYKGADSRLSGRFILGGENRLIGDFFGIAAGLLQVDAPAEVKAFDQLEEDMKEFCQTDELNSSKAIKAGLETTIKIEDMIHECLRGLAERKLIRLRN